MQKNIEKISKTPKKILAFLILYAFGLLPVFGYIAAVSIVRDRPFDDSLTLNLFCFIVLVSQLIYFIIFMQYVLNRLVS